MTTVGCSALTLVAVPRILSSMHAARGVWCVASLALLSCGGGGHTGGHIGADGGPCTPPNCVIALASGSPWGVAVDASSVYWTNTVYNTVQKIPLGGGLATTLVSALPTSPTNIVVDSTSAYFSDPPDLTNTTAGALMKVPLAGGALVTLVATQSVATAPRAVAVDATSVYWTTLGDPNTSVPSTVMSVPIGGGTPTTLVSSTQTQIVDVAVDSTSAYFSADNTTASGGAIMKVPVGGGTPVTLAATQAAPLRLVVDSNAVYWVGLDGTIMKVDLGGGAPVTLAPSPNIPADIRSDGSFVYWTTSAGVVKVSVTGGNSTLVANVGGLTLAVDDTSVYWASGTSVLKAPK